jgi:HEAT repeat protein
LDKISPHNASSLTSQDCPEDLAALIRELTSGDDRRAEASVNCLARRGSLVLPAITPLLQAPEADTRWWAVRLLAEIGDGEAVDHIIRALQDEDASVRQCATLAISRQGDERAVPSLIQLLSDGDSLMVRLAANALVLIGPPAVPALLDLLQQGAPVARFEAVRALALIGDPRAFSALMGVLEEDSALMDYWANEGLERMGAGMLYFSPGS